MILLVRDPRGTLSSRRFRDWCPNRPDCADSQRHCDDLVSDFYFAKKLKKLFPNRFR